MMYLILFVETAGNSFQFVVVDAYVTSISPELSLYSGAGQLTTLELSEASVVISISLGQAVNFGGS